MALQSCALIKPLSIDFNRASQILELEQESLPALDAIFLEITALEKFNIAVEQQPSDGMIPYGDTLKIKLSDWQRPAEFRIKFGGSRNKLSVVLSAHYRLDRKWRRLTIEEVDSAINGIQRSLARSRADLQSAKSALSILPSRINSLASQFRNASGTNSAALNSQLNTAKRQFAKVKGMARRTSRLVPELEAKLPVMQQLGSLGNRLHEIARIQFRVMVKTDNGSFDLLRTTDEVVEVVDEVPSKGNSG